MHHLLLHFKKNFVPRRVLDALLAQGRLTIISECGSQQVFESPVEVHLIPDTRDLAALKTAVTGILRRHPVDQLLTPFEANQVGGGYLRTLLGLPGRGFDEACACTNKVAMKRRYARAGLPMPDFEVAFDLAEVPVAAHRLGWPLVVKPALGGGGKHVVGLQGPAEFERLRVSPAAAAMHALELPFVVERMVRMSGEYHCDGIVVDGRVQFLAVSRYLSPLLGCDERRNGSYLLAPDSADARAIAALHERAVRAVGLTDSITHMELFKTADGFLCGEIAGRVAGGGIPEAILMATGVDLWEAWLDLACGRVPEIEAKEPGRVFVNYHLPARPGRIRRISSEADLSGLPGVVKVHMSRQADDEIPSDLNTSSSSGLVFLALPDEAAVEGAIDLLASRFVLDMVADNSPAREGATA